jgi:HAD superfamily hydrolase (TIGR01493 family)
MGAYRAVMFDWILTRADYPDLHEHLRRAHQQLGRASTDEDIDAWAARLREAVGHDDIRAAMATEDCSAELHRAANERHYDRAGLDAELAAAMYGLLGHPSFHPIYPDVAPALEAIHGVGIPIAVVSDFHVDLREHARLAGLDGLVDHWIISFEHGVQKPDPAIYQLALDALGTSPEDTLMVGDRPTHDGAAATLGIDTLILPVRDRPPGGDRLRPVLALLLDGPSSVAR